MSASKKIPILESERVLLPGSSPAGKINLNERIKVTVLVRRTATNQIRNIIEQNISRLPKDRHHITHDEFSSRFGASPDDVSKIRSFAKDYGLEVIQANMSQCKVTLVGTIAQLSEAFDVKLVMYDHPSGMYRGRVGKIHVPIEISNIVQGVFGLDNRAQAKPHFRRFKKNQAKSNMSYTPTTLATLYDFPQGLDGSNQCIGIIELGGGYNASDLGTYFKKICLDTPNVFAVSVDGVTNSPTGSVDGPDGEVMLDIEVAGAIAPKSNLAVYFGPNTDIGFLDTIDAAIHDKINKPSVISISWGSAESNWTLQSLNAFNQAFENASALGITICAAAGDDGSSDGVDDGLAHVDFPASSPYVLACGGTRVESLHNKIVMESVWNDLPNGGATGGGISDTFDLPVWQSGAHVPPSTNSKGHIGRGVPDVAGNADPITGYDVLVDGEETVIGGTSAVAPLYAGLVAIINQGTGHQVGYLNPLFYKKIPSPIFSDIVSGNNGSYKAGLNWDACTGLGRIDGAKFFDALKTSSDL